MITCTNPNPTEDVTGALGHTIAETVKVASELCSVLSIPQSDECEADEPVPALHMVYLAHVDRLAYTNAVLGRVLSQVNLLRQIAS